MDVLDFEGFVHWNQKIWRIKNIPFWGKPKTLSERLKELKAKGIIERKAYPTIPPTMEYSLTEKGQSLKPIIKAMKLWGAQWG